ncbi:hypothetical protein BOTNAR_0045g00280 [Botryotinia narcissicola]|uniref:Uncharacterized protein n=1 Tax=Botryotinia narcissicola TaxID=278944 RepID=A0A4Z1J292_9HELO|nr:hypothetical protein BOTNAR_0045g00280 [Botryotinia narcissicola]
MNDNDKQIMIGVLQQIDRVDLKVLAQSLHPELEPAEITRTMVESLRIRWKGLKQRHGIEPPPTTPNVSPKKDTNKAVNRASNGSGRGRKRKVNIEDNNESEPPSPMKKKDKGQGKAVVKLDISDKGDKAFEDAIFAYGPDDEA